MTSPFGFVHVGEEAQAFQWNSKPCCAQWRPNDSTSGVLLSTKAHTSMSSLSMCRTISFSAGVKPLAVQRAMGFADLLMRLRTCSTLLAQTRSYPLPLSTSHRRTWLVATGAAGVGTGQVVSVMLLRAGRFNLTSFVVVRAAARRSKMFGLLPKWWYSSKLCPMVLSPTSRVSFIGLWSVAASVVGTPSSRGLYT